MNTIFKSKKAVGVVMAFVVFFAAGVTATAASWQGTSWINNGSVISAQNMKDNFDFLYDRLVGPNGVAYFPNGIRIGYYSGACNASASGTLRWTNTGFEGCNGVEWIALPSDRATCTVVEEEQSCNIPYSCNCGKYGCSTCYKAGKQYRAIFTCPSSLANTGWSSCQE